VLSTTSCGGLTDATRPGIRLISGPAQTDTIDAHPAEPFVVEIRDSNGAYQTPYTIVVSSSALGSAASSPSPVYVSESADGSGRPFALVPLDTDGRARFWVRWGTKIGHATLSIRGFDVTSTIDLQAEAGHGAAIVASPSDTAVYVGGQYPVQAQVTDRHGNPRPDRVEMSTEPGLALAGGVVTASQPGRHSIRMTSGAVSENAWVSVVPRGQLIAYQRSAVTGPSVAAIVSVGLDGSGLRRLVITTDQYPQALTTLSRSPDGTTLAYTDRQNSNTRIFLLRGAATAPLDTAVRGELYPAFSPDGKWIYFNTGYNGVFTLWRVRADGTGAEGLPGQPYWSGVPLASPSPDGRRLVCGTTGPDSRGYLFDLESHRWTPLPPAVMVTPQWAPGSDWIAFSNAAGEVFVIRSDGTGMRRVSLPGHTYGSGPRWSADGRYLMAANTQSDVLELIDVETGDALPIPFAHRMRSPILLP
jgi:WD40 repeat protein